MHVNLDMTDAMELEQLLDFLARWMKAEHDCLAPSLARFLGTDHLGFEVEFEGSEANQIGHFGSRRDGAQGKNGMEQSYYIARFKPLTKSPKNHLEVTPRQLHPEAP